MDKKLNISWSVQPNCKLIAVDETDYSSLEVDLTQHVRLEFLSYNEDKAHLPRTVVLRKESETKDVKPEDLMSAFVFERDGSFYYYKLVIPLIKHFKHPSQDKYYHLHNELFYHEGKIYKCKLGDGETTYDLSAVLAQSDIISNYIDAYNLVQNGEGTQTVYCPKEFIFVFCNLQKCLVALQKKLLFSNICSCSFERCSTDETIRNRRDFLLSALYVLDYLKNIKNYEEAQKLIESLSTCNSICGDASDGYNSNDDCGCGSIIY